MLCNAWQRKALHGIMSALIKNALVRCALPGLAPPGTARSRTISTLIKNTVHWLGKQCVAPLRPASPGLVSHCHTLNYFAPPKNTVVRFAASSTASHRIAWQCIERIITSTPQSARRVLQAVSSTLRSGHPVIPPR